MRKPSLALGFLIIVFVRRSVPADASTRWEKRRYMFVWIRRKADERQTYRAGVAKNFRQEIYLWPNRAPATRNNNTLSFCLVCCCLTHYIYMTYLEKLVKMNTFAFFLGLYLLLVSYFINFVIWENRTIKSLVAAYGELFDAWCAVSMCSDICQRKAPSSTIVCYVDVLLLYYHYPESIWDCTNYYVYFHWIILFLSLLCFCMDPFKLGKKI